MNIKQKNITNIKTMLKTHVNPIKQRKNTIDQVITIQEQTLIEKGFEKSILENSFYLRTN